MEQGQPSETEAIIRGGILAESLNPGTGFDGHGMRITRCARFEVTGAAGYQPPDGLLSPGWYANWNGDIEATVVFPGKVFRYPRGDQAGREEAKAHGRSVGVPEPQLDWTD